MLRALLRARRRGKILAALDRIASGQTDIAIALDRIAAALERKKGFHSSAPTADEADAADFLAQSDEDFAFLDALEDQRARAGRAVGLDEDLEDEYLGLPRGDEKT